MPERPHAPHSAHADRRRAPPCAATALPRALLLGVVLGAAVLFGLLAIAVNRGGALTLLDARLDAWLHTHASVPITRVMLAVATVHDTLGILLLTGALALYLRRHASLDWLVTLLFAVPGVMLLNVALKHLFRRPRPHFEHPLATLATFSFPSGHVADSTAFYGFIALWWISCHAGARQRGLAVLPALLMIGLVAGCRLYLGVHYLSDVLAGFCESVAWLGLCLLGRQAAADRRGRAIR